MKMSLILVWETRELAKNQTNKLHSDYQELFNTEIILKEDMLVAKVGWFKKKSEIRFQNTFNCS